MALDRRCALAALGFLAGAALAQARTADAPSKATLRESAQPGQTTQLILVLKAEGNRILETEPAVADSRAKPATTSLPFQVEGRFECVEKVAAIDQDGAPRRLVRRAKLARATIGHFRDKGQTMALELRPEVSLLIAERRPEGVVNVSAGGPLTRSELDLIQLPGDPLGLADLLPDHPVAVGDTWTVGPLAARALSEYEAIAANRLEATLKAIDDDSARIELSGEVRGAVRGGEGSMRFRGQFSFDRKAGRIDRLALNRVENRAKGLVESALDVKSTVQVERKAIEGPPELSDSALDGLPLEANPSRELLLLAPPGGKYTLVYDRDWHIVADDTRQTVLKRLDHGEFVAQCNLTMGPSVGRGRHEDLVQFREDIRRALGERFVRYIGAGEVGGAPAGGFRYKVAVEGQAKDVQPIWYYYLVASPEGDQLLATFTLSKALEERFGDQDLRMIGSLEWTEANESGGKN